MLQVLVFGTGSIGAVYAYIFQQGGAAVTTVCRSNYDAAKADGFKIFSPKFGDVIFKPDHVVQTAEEAASLGVTFDFIVVCSKSFPGSNPSLSDMIKPALGTSTSIVLIQNGISIEEEVSTAFPSNPLLSCVVYLPTTQTEPGTIYHRELLDLLEIGTFPVSAPAAHKTAAEKLASLIRSGNGHADVHDDIQPCRWSKLLMNASLNPICALSWCSDAQFLASSDPWAHDLLWGVMLEIVAIAQSLGIKGMDKAKAKSQIARSEARVAKGTGVEPSMLADVRNGRTFEVEAIVGNTVRLARQNGVKVPLLDALYALAKGRFEAMKRQNGVEAS